MDQSSAFPLLMLFWAALVSGHRHGPDDTIVAVTEGSDAILGCSLDPPKSLDQDLFDWIKDEKTDVKKEVFMYSNGSHDNNGLSGQDKQFQGRVSHFPDQLINGNASIIIRNTTIEDAGDYTCLFLLPQGQEQKCNIKLVVGVAHKPYVSVCNVSESGVQLKCEVEGAFPQPEVQWLDSDGTVLSAEDPEVVERGGRFDITLQTTVIATDGNCFRCVVKQQHFHHEIGYNITVPEKLFEKTPREVDPGSCSGRMVLVAFIGVFLGGLLLAAGLALLVATNRMTVRLNAGRR
ncbi:V-set domain-containing T-cell activation inhibitor 1-like isoform X2 [Stegastes partitus]|uniref:V-set domain-containing T-cell activation inhibitor 1-like n=1 Tax=Stegastes partitus TaxID=144197 RepID=A0A3B4ZBV2_9TELE|nr:PREDICTED: V-set domain-containing T-cell activation inhibitor 1-like isoform X2 [Stegastes partitus]